MSNIFNIEASGQSKRKITCYDRSMKKDTHAFGQRLAKFRKDKKMSQLELGKLMGVSRGMIAYYESAAKNPTVEVIENAASALGVSIGQLLGDDLSIVSNKPKTKLEKLCDQLSSLPRSKQKTVVEMLEGFLEKTAS